MNIILNRLKRVADDGNGKLLKTEIEKFSAELNGAVNKIGAYKKYLEKKMKTTDEEIQSNKDLTSKQKSQRENALITYHKYYEDLINNKIPDLAYLAEKFELYKNTISKNPNISNEISVKMFNIMEYIRKYLELLKNKSGSTFPKTFWVNLPNMIERYKIEEKILDKTFEVEEVNKKTTDEIVNTPKKKMTKKGTNPTVYINTTKETFLNIVNKMSLTIAKDAHTDVPDTTILKEVIIVDGPILKEKNNEALTKVKNFIINNYKGFLQQEMERQLSTNEQFQYLSNVKCTDMVLDNFLDEGVRFYGTITCDKASGYGENHKVESMIGNVVFRNISWKGGWGTYEDGQEIEIKGVEPYDMTINVIDKTFKKTQTNDAPNLEKSKDFRGNSQVSTGHNTNLVMDKYINELMSGKAKLQEQITNNSKNHNTGCKTAPELFDKLISAMKDKRKDSALTAQQVRELTPVLEIINGIIKGFTNGKGEYKSLSQYINNNLTKNKIDTFLKNIGYKDPSTETNEIMQQVSLVVDELEEMGIEEEEEETNNDTKNVTQASYKNVIRKRLVAMYK